MIDPAARAELQRNLIRLAAGDRAAFDAVFARLWPVLREFAARHLPSGDADDAAQRGLLRVFERASSFDPARDGLAWAVGLTVWEIRTLRRRSWRRRETTMPSGGFERTAAERSPEDEAIAADLAATLGRTLATLRPADAETLLRFAHDERGSGARFRKRLQRARERIRAAWRLHYG
jgi:RNA polymerase sigma-70 factor (ECF subfamily)